MAGRNGLANGNKITVRNRSFGDELRSGQNTEPFHLILMAQAQRELDTVRVDR